MPMRAVAPLLLVAGFTAAQSAPVLDAAGSLPVASTMWRLALHSMH